MKLRFTARARIRFDQQIDYLIEAGSAKAARRLANRTEQFLKRFVVRYPSAGTFVAERDIWEIWVPRTRLVLWYRFTASELTVIDIWHTSQDRQGGGEGQP